MWRDYYIVFSTIELLLSLTGRAAGPARAEPTRWPGQWPGLAGLACHRRPSNVPHLSSSQCRSDQAVAHFVGKVYYRRAAAIQHTVETPP